MTVTFLLGFNTIDAKLSPIEEGLVAPEWPDTPKDMNGPDVYMREVMEECAKGYRESLPVFGDEYEIFSVKCSHKMLAYIINTLYNQGFRIISLSRNEPLDPIWVINYCY